MDRYIGRPGSGGKRSSEIYMHTSPEGGDKCEGEVAKGLLGRDGLQGEESSDGDMDVERQDEGRREMEKFVHGIRNGEVVGGPANERRVRHATWEVNRPSFWTYLNVNGCRGCQKHEEDETIHHVISGRCEGIGKKANSRFREEMMR
eukprot:6182232-Pleurochrysis_carterae.AAC.1